MEIEPEHPEIPMPAPPGRSAPQRRDPVMVPVVPIGGDDPWQRLAEQRRVLVNGPLDRPTVTELAAELMAFDGTSSRDVEIVINSTGGPMSEIFPLLDVVDLMRAKVNATVVGAAFGTAAAIVARATGQRRAAPNAMFALRVQDHDAIRGSASDISTAVGELAAARRRYIDALVSATGLEAQTVENMIDRGETFDAERAIELGVIDSIRDDSPPRRSAR